MRGERPALPRLADAAALLALVVLPLLAWRREGVVPAPGQAWWVVESDAYLFGPDAAAWAQNALALNQDRLADLDPHRMPTWTLLTSAVMDLTGWDVALSGHLVNRAEHVLLGPVVYLLGRALGMGAWAFAAAALVAIQPALLAAACRFGVDPTVTFLVPLMLLTAWAGGRAWAFAPVAGAVAALTMVSHLTALAFPLCGLLLCAVSARGGWRGLVSVLLYAGAGWLVFRQVFEVFPMLPQHIFADALAEGVAPTHDPNAAPPEVSRQAAMELVRTNAPLALDRAIRLITTTFRPVGVPWPAAVALLWLGFLGPAPFGPRPEGDTAWRWVGRLLRSGLQGFAVASALAPLLAFAAAGAPERYSDNLLPVAALVLARGAATAYGVAAAVARAAARRWPALDAGVALAQPAVALLLALVWVGGEWREPHARAAVLAPREERNALLVGRALAEHFPAGGGGASAMREALPYAGLRYCPVTVCPFSDDEAGYRRCVEIIRKECQGEGDIPLVVTDGLTLEQRPERRAHFEAWIEARLTPLATVGGSRIYAIPRTGEL